MLATVTPIYYKNFVGIYDTMEVVLEGPTSSLLTWVSDHTTSITKQSEIMASLWWLVVFPIKLAYLAFYRLIAQFRRLRIWWWCVITFMVCDSILIPSNLKLVLMINVPLQIPSAIACTASSALTCTETKTLEIVGKLRQLDSNRKLHLN